LFQGGAWSVHFCRASQSFLKKAGGEDQKMFPLQNFRGRLLGLFMRLNNPIFESFIKSIEDGELVCMWCHHEEKDQHARSEELKYLINI
jgi:hypothetical protein